MTSGLPDLLKQKEIQYFIEKELSSQRTNYTTPVMSHESNNLITMKAWSTSKERVDDWQFDFKEKEYLFH